MGDYEMHRQALSDLCKKQIRKAMEQVCQDGITIERVDLVDEAPVVIDVTSRLDTQATMIPTGEFTMQLSVTYRKES